MSGRGNDKCKDPARWLLWEDWLTHHLELLVKGLESQPPSSVNTEAWYRLLVETGAPCREQLPASVGSRGGEKENMVRSSEHPASSHWEDRQAPGHLDSCEGHIKPAEA